MYLLQLSLLYLYLCTTSLNPSYLYQHSSSSITTCAAQTATVCTCIGDVFTSDSDVTPIDDVTRKSANLQLQNHKKTSSAWDTECNLTDRTKQKEEEKSSLIWTVISVLLYVYFLCVPLRLSQSARDVSDIEVRTLSL